MPLNTQPQFEPTPAAALVVLEPILRAQVNRGCPEFLRSQADDLVQSGLIRLARAHSRGQTLSKAYVKQVAWSVTVDAIRKAKRTADHPTAEGPTALRTIPGGLSPEEGASLSELRQALRDCLSALTVASKDVITLYLLGHTIRESSNQMGVTPKQAENRIYRGLGTLRDCLRSKGVQP